MKIEQNVRVVANTIECERCGEVHEFEKSLAELNSSYRVDGISHVTYGGKYRESADPFYWFCSKDCLVDFMKYQLSQIWKPIEP